MNFGEVKTRAMSLTFEERAALVRLLLESLEEPSEMSNEKVSALPVPKAPRRLEAVRRGDMVLLTRQELEGLLEEESDRAVAAERQGGGTILLEEMKEQLGL